MTMSDPQDGVPYFPGRGLTGKPLRDAALREADRLMPLFAEESSSGWYLHDGGRGQRDMSRLLRRLVWECERLSAMAHEAREELARAYCRGEGYSNEFGWPVGDQTVQTMADAIIERTREAPTDQSASDRYLEGLGVPPWPQQVDPSGPPYGLPRPKVRLFPVPSLERFMRDRFGGGR